MADLRDARLQFMLQRALRGALARGQPLRQREARARSADDDEQHDALQAVLAAGGSGLACAAVEERSGFELQKRRGQRRGSRDYGSQH